MENIINEHCEWDFYLFREFQNFEEERLSYNPRKFNRELNKLKSPWEPAMHFNLLQTLHLN